MGLEGCDAPPQWAGLRGNQPMGTRRDIGVMPGTAREWANPRPWGPRRAPGSSLPFLTFDLDVPHSPHPRSHSPQKPVCWTLKGLQHMNLERGPASFELSFPSCKKIARRRD